MPGDRPTAFATFEQVAAIAERFGDPDLTAMGRLGRGQSLIAMGEIRRGVRLLDEAMIAVIAGEVSPIESRDRLLRGHRGVPVDVRSAAGPGMDDAP